MSDTKVPHPGNIYGHYEAHVAELKSLYSGQFSGRMISCDWPDGWHSIVLDVCEFAEKHYPETRWVQIKEKFAGLRMYYGGGSFRVDMQGAGRLISFRMPQEGGQRAPEFEEVVCRAEALSLKTCCLCGAQGDADGVECHKFGGWLLTACERCVPIINAYRALPIEAR